jgi:ubiquinone/menaquinone biosynthesis C-methylase UbiE
VTAIDKLEREIEEARLKAPEAIWKVADACNLLYEANSFDNAIAFFSLMYMRKPGVQEDVFKEVYRVLQSNGEFWIWDAIIPENKNVYVIFLKIQLPRGKSIKTGCGTKGGEKQSPQRRFRGY